MKFFLRFILVFSCTFSVAQSSLIERLHLMQKNPRLKEKVYVHTNKTSYFPDDIIWFKAYVGDSTNLPSVQTQILEVRLFDGEGTQLFDRTVAITGGTGSGQIELNDAIAPGIYYLQARTNYMRNFGEEYQYLQEITILGKIPPNISVEEHEKYDVQLLPESGNLIEDSENNLGIKAMLNSRSIDFQGVIINEKGETITTFQSEHEGMGRCSFLYKKGETYRAKIKVQDTLIEKIVPAALTKGVSLSVDNSDEDNLKVYLKTNEATFYNQVYSNYTLLYHQDRQLFELVSVARLDSLTGLVETKKDIFLDGVHTVTLFADDRPIAQRKFYIETDQKKSFVSLEKSKIDSDSITYRLLSKGKKKNLDVDLSVSILQKNSEAVNVKNTISSAFLLTPYVRGYIENPAYYFDTENKKRKEHLDLLLLTQGWTGYTLNEVIEAISPIEKYTFETGFELKGEIKDEIKRKKLVLIPENFNIIDKVNLQGRPEFVFQNLSVFKGDTVRVAYQSWLGKIIKPSKIEYDTIHRKKVAELNIPKALKIPTVEKNAANDFDKTKKNGATVTGTDTDTDTQLRNLDGTIDLDEVIVTERKRSEKYLERRKLIKKYEPLVSGIGKYYDLPVSKVSSNYNITLLDFLALQGFQLWTRDNIQYFLINPATLNFFRGPQLGFLYIDGRPVAPEQLASVQLKKKDIENIMVSNEINPVTIFQVFTSDSYSKGTTVLFDRFVIKNGFDRAKKYYTPLYVFERSRPTNLLEVDWKPNLKTDKKDEVTFKIVKDDKVNSLLFYIQGFSNEGHLISKAIGID